jgi:hypothetical protein
MSEEHRYENRVGKYFGPGTNQGSDDSLILDQVAISHRFKQHLPKLKPTIADLHAFRDAYIKAPTRESANYSLAKLIIELKKADLWINDPLEKDKFVKKLDEAREAYIFPLLATEFESQGS